MRGMLRSAFCHLVGQPALCLKNTPIVASKTVKRRRRKTALVFISDAIRRVSGGKI
jgi:hypothetical protein